MGPPAKSFTSDCERIHSWGRALKAIIVLEGVAHLGRLPELSVERLSSNDFVNFEEKEGKEWLLQTDTKQHLLFQDIVYVLGDENIVGGEGANRLWSKHTLVSASLPEEGLEIKPKAC